MGVDVDFVLQHGDPRVEGWPMMDSPRIPIITTCLYVIFIKIIGPAIMQNKKPYELRSCMIFYNIAMVAISSWMFLRFAYGWLTTYNWRCEPVDYTNSENGIRPVVTCYVFFLSKFLEYFDTVFFVLRKKYSQITRLHVFHHGLIPITAWYGVKFGCGGYLTILPMANAFVHIWMYAYYGLSAMGPTVQKYLWWKRHLTKLQLLQFIVVFLFMTRILLFPPENCNTSMFLISLALGQVIIFFVLFIHFYVRSYKKKVYSQSNGDASTTQPEKENGHYQKSRKVVFISHG